MGGYASGVFIIPAAFCITGDTASGDPLVGGSDDVVLHRRRRSGGSAPSGGYGTVVGSVIGALIIGFINRWCSSSARPRNGGELV